LGSQAIAKAYYDLDIDVEAMMQLDMTMYGKNETQPIGVVTDYVNPALTAFVKVIIGGYSKFPFTNTACGYACSDHASWTKYGYRSSTPFESVSSAMNPYIHSQNDLIKNLNLARGLEFCKIAVGFLVELGGGAF